MGNLNARRACLPSLLIAGCSFLALYPLAARSAESTVASVETVVVTAQRRAEKLEEVPMSVVALPAQNLQNQGVFDFDNLTRATTGLRIGRTGVFTQPAIRGVTTPTLGPGQENNVATYVDGFYQPEQLALSGDLIGLESVQVLKGPQGSLYGRNATGGAILITTVDPTTDMFKGSINVGYARYQDKRVNGMVNVPINDKVAFNVVAHWRDTPSYIRDINGIYNGTGSRTDPPPYGVHRDIGYVLDWGVKAKLKIDFSDNVTLIAGYRHRFFADNRAGSFFMTDYPALPRDPGTGFNIGGYDYVGASVPPVNDVEVNDFTAKLQIQTVIGTITSYTSYTDQHVLFNGDFDGTKLDVVQSGREFPRQTFQQAVDFNITSIDRLNLIVGGHYFDDDGTGGTDVQLNGALVSGLGSNLKTKAWAIFADGTYEVADRLFVAAGIRFSQETKRLRSVYDCCGLDGVALTPGGQLEKTYANVTPRGVIRYELSEGTNIYASVSRGFKSGTFNSVGSTPASVGSPVRPETITAYEVGFKTAQHNFRIESAAYYYDYKNLQLTRLLILPTGVDQVLQNAATAEIYGADLSAEWSPLDQLKLNASVDYNHARYKKYPNGAATIPIGGFLTSVSQDFSGIRIPRASDWTFNFNVEYTIPTGDSEVSIAGNVFYASQYTPTTPSYDPATRKPYFNQPGYAQVNASVTWHSPGDKYELGVYVNNITNERYRIWYNAGALGAWYVFSEPLVWGMRAGVNF